MTTNSQAFEDDPLIFTNYDSKLRQFISGMLVNAELADAILICENRSFPVHKFLLSASSSFFNNMFKKTNSLTIHDVKRRDLKRVLEYIYTGEIKLSAYQVPPFIDATKKLSVPISCDEMKNISTNHGLTFTRSQSQDCHSNSDVEEDERNCNENQAVSLKSLRITRSKPTEDSSRQKISGIVEVSRKEFLNRMLKAKGLQLSGDCLVQINPTLPSVTLPSTSLPTPSSQPEIVPKVVQKPNSIKKEPPKPSLSRKAEKEANRQKQELRRLINERRKNVAGLQKRIVRLLSEGVDKKIIDRDRQALVRAEKGLEELLEDVTKSSKR